MAEGIQLPPPPTPITIGGAKTQVQPNAGQGYGSVTPPAPPTPIAISGQNAGVAQPSNSIQNISQAYLPKSDPTVPQKGLYGQLSDLAGKIPGAGALAKGIGSTFAGTAGAIDPLLHGNFQLAADTARAGNEAAAKENKSNFSKIVGDAASAVVTPATLAMGGGEGATVAGKIANAGLKYGAGGALTGAGNSLSQGGTPTQVGSSALQGGLYGALGGAAGQAAGEAGSALAKNSGLQKIVASLMPNVRSTGPEVRAAMDEGRIIDGTKSTFWGSTPDTIAPRDKAIVNAQTLEKHIPGVADMSSQNKVRAIDSKTDAMAENLSPVMKATPITKSDTGKVIDAWKQLKQTQADIPAFADAPSNAKMQKQFERHLGNLQWDITGEGGKFQTPTPKSLDDIWQTQKDYDASVPDDVKNLGPNADRIDKLQHSMWLQNRTLLTSLRDDLASRLEPGIRKTFNDMSNMYDARRAIVKNAKIDTKGSQGVIKKGLYKALGYGTGALGLTGAGALLGEHLTSSSPH